MHLWLCHKQGLYTQGEAAVFRWNVWHIYNPLGGNVLQNMHTSRHTYKRVCIFAGCCYAQPGASWRD